MPFSLADYLHVVSPHLPSALMSPELLQHIRGLTRDLPPVSLVGFESALVSDDAMADFAIGLTAASHSRELFARYMARMPCVDERLAAPGWQRFGAFTTMWSDAASPLYADTGTVWLEWDLANSVAEMPAPNVLFGMRPGNERQARIELGVQCLLGRPLVPQVQQQFVRCFTALPPHTGIFQVGVMLARQVDGVRVCVFPVTVEQAGEYLAHLGWPGDVEDMVRTLAPFGEFATTMALAVDVGADVAPKIGLECYMDDRRRPEATPGWAALLDYLVAQDMCTGAKRAALLAWPGIQRTTEFVWARTFTRGLNHLKLVYEPGRPLVAKAYWGFAQGWATVRATREPAEVAVQPSSVSTR